MTTTDHIPAWAKYQASKSEAAREKRDAFFARLDRHPASRPVAFTPEQQARHDQLQALLDQCAPGMSAGALDWSYASRRKAPDMVPVKAGYDSWLSPEEKRALRPLMKMHERRNASDPLEVLDYAMAAAATGIPLSRTSEKLSAAFNRASRRGLFDVLLESLADGQLDDTLSQSRRDQITRVARQGSKQGKMLRERDKQRKGSSDDLAKSRLRRAST